MNDVGYDTSLKFKESVCYSTIITASKEQLNNARPYYVGAIAYHTKENNKSQIEFFSEGLTLIDKRLKKTK